MDFQFDAFALHSHGFQLICISCRGRQRFFFPRALFTYQKPQLRGDLALARERRTITIKTHSLVSIVQTVQPSRSFYGPSYQTRDRPPPLAAIFHLSVSHTQNRLWSRCHVVSSRCRGVSSLWSRALAYGDLRALCTLRESGRTRGVAQGPGSDSRRTHLRFWYFIFYILKLDFNIE
jgi:hypothetical protein